MSKFVFLKSLRELLTPLKRLIDRKAEDVDWNENDSSASGYIKNRPFYTSDPVLTTIIPKTTVTLQDQGGMFGEMFASPALLEHGNTYVVNWNGTEYTTVCAMAEGAYYIGDISMMTGGTSTGEPFVIIVMPGEGVNMGAVIGLDITSAQDVTFSVLGEKIEIIKIPLEYLPEISNVGKEGTGEGAEIFNDYESNVASGEYSHAEGFKTKATGEGSHAEGTYSRSSGVYSHAEGDNSRALGYASHAENSSEASGRYSHAEGWGTIAYRDYSHAEGYNTQANSTFQHVQGKFNIVDSASKYAHIVGNGSSSSAKKNAHTLDWNGLGWFAGGLKVGGTGQDDVNAVEVALKTDIPSTEGLATESYVDEQFNKPKDSVAFVDQVNGYTYIACMRDGNFVTYCGVKFIEVTVLPNKTEYMVGEYLDPTGMIVTATTYDGVTKEIADFTCSSTYITEDDTSAEITYIESGITHTTTVPITVTPFDPAVVLIDFEYTANENGTYTITGWKETYNGEASTELIVPNNGLIVI